MENYYYDKIEPVKKTCIWLGGTALFVLLLILVGYDMNVLILVGYDMKAAPATAIFFFCLFLFIFICEKNLKKIDFYTSGSPDVMYEIGKSYIRKNDVQEAVRWFRYAALRGNIEAQRQLSEIYRPHNGLKAYMWAYLVYLCNRAIKPNPKDYGLNVSEAAGAEAEAQKIYDNIQQREQNV